MEAPHDNYLAEKYFHNTGYNTEIFYQAVENRITSLETEAEVQRRLAQGSEASIVAQSIEETPMQLG